VKEVAVAWGKEKKKDTNKRKEDNSGGDSGLY